MELIASIPYPIGSKYPKNLDNASGNILKRASEIERLHNTKYYQVKVVQN